MRGVVYIFMRLLMIVLLLVPSLTSCITNKSLTLLQDSKNMPQYEQAEYSYYKIQKNDMLQIRLLTTNDEAAQIFGFSTGSNSSSSSSYSYRVYDDGTIDIPFIKGIPVAGLTIREASKVIESSIQEYVPDAMVKMCLANDKFYIIAEGNKKACDLYKEKLNIFQALAVTGNISTNADRKRVKILRPDMDGKTRIMEFDMRSKSIIGSEYYYIQPNDVIYIASIKGNFFRTESYSESIGSISSSIGFLVTVFNLGVQTGLFK